MHRHEVAAPVAAPAAAAGPSYVDAWACEHLAAERIVARLEEDERVQRMQQEASDAAKARVLQTREDAKVAKRLATDDDAMAAAARARRRQQEDADARLAQQLHDEMQAAVAPGLEAPNPQTTPNPAPPPLPKQPPAGVVERPIVIIDGPNVGRSHNLGWKSPHGFDYSSWVVQRSKRGSSPPSGPSSPSSPPLPPSGPHPRGAPFPGPAPPLCASAIVAAVDFWRKRGYEVKAVLPQHFLQLHSHSHAHQLTLGADALTPLIEDDILVQTPSNCDDDDFLLSRAKRCADNGQHVIILTNDHYRNWVNGTRAGHAWFDATWRDDHVCKFAWDDQQLQPASKFLQAVRAPAARGAT